MLKKNCSLIMSGDSEELIMQLKGEIDHHSAVRIRTQMDGRINELLPKRAILELSGIEFMDSSGVGLIMGRYMRMQAIGGKLIVRNPNERIVKIFKLAGLEKIVNIEVKESKNEG